MDFFCFHTIICLLVMVLHVEISTQSAVCTVFTRDYDSFGCTKNFDLYWPGFSGLKVYNYLALGALVRPGVNF